MKIEIMDTMFRALGAVLVSHIVGGELGLEVYKIGILGSGLYLLGMSKP